MLRYVALVLLILLIALQVRLWSGQGGIHDVDRLRARVEQHRVENAKLKARNDTLAAEVEDLKHGDDAIEERARTEIGLLKPGETFYQVVDQSADKPRDGKKADGGK